MRCFVVPSLPTAFVVAELYDETLHSRLMEIIVGLLRHIIAGKDDSAQTDDVVYMITQYARYGGESGRGHSGIELFREDEDRQKLVNFLRSYIPEIIRSHFCGIHVESGL